MASAGEWGPCGDGVSYQGGADRPIHTFELHSSSQCGI